VARILHRILLGLMLCFSFLAQAQDASQTLYSQSDLDQMLAPIALYSDDLLSNVLTAATYPLEVVQADRYVKQNPNLQGNALADALNTQPWDASVKALAQFPSVLAMMDDELSWTQELGNAFLAQQSDVMTTVQSLRAKAAANGTLQSNPQQTVESQGNDIGIEPPAPDVVYVPYYDPNLVYGVWWWPAQLPLFWSPPPVYRPYNFGNVGAGGIAYGGRVVVNGAGFSRFRPNWGARTIAVTAPHGAGAIAWQHDPAHRHGLAYRTAPTANRAVQQATPPAWQRQAVTRAAPPEPVRQITPAPVPRVEPMQPRPMPPAPAPAEVRAAPAQQHTEGGHSESNHSEAAHNSDPRKPNAN
jgi:hypothetical protein